MELDVIYAAALKPGDLWAGTVNPDAPTRPVGNFARAMRITDAQTVTDEDGRKIVQCQAHGLALTPIPISQQVLVIRTGGAGRACGCCVDNECECNGANLRNEYT